MKNKKRIIILAAIVALLTICFFGVKSLLNKKRDNIINITSLSREFMDNYFKGVEKLNANDNKDNILIVTSLNGISDPYGASDIVEAPNHQYFLQYENEIERNNALEKFKSDKTINYVEENGTYVATDYNSWGVEKLKVDDAITYTESNYKNEVVVAVIDTGCDVALFNESYEGRLAGTYDVLDPENETLTDENGHGTHVSGIVADASPSNVKVLPVKAGDGTFSYMNLIAAVNYITYDHKADVINMSLGGYGGSSSFKTALDAAAEQNIINVAAAGNNNSSLNHYPSSYDNTMSIASISDNLNKSYFSNYGPTIDFAAPGSSIKSINGVKSGTSMASPFAAAAVAILKSYNIDIDLDDTIELLKKHAIDLGETGRDDYYGNGVISFINATFCDSSLATCDEYGVFTADEPEGLEISKLEQASPYYVPYDYGNITNLMNMPIRIYFGDNIFITKELGDLDDVEIENYDRNVLYDVDNSTGTVNVSITYQNKTLEADVRNIYTLNNGWNYETVGDSSDIKINSINYGNIESQFPRTIYMPDSIDGHRIVTIGQNLFKNRDDLKHITLPNNVVIIEQSAFENCTNVSQMHIPNSVLDIGDSAFKNANIEDVEFSESLSSIGDHAFENTSITSVYIPRNVTYVGNYAFAGCNNIESIEVDSGNLLYDSRNDCNAIVDKNANAIIKGNYLTTIPTTVTTIETGAFYNDNRITDLVIPDNVTSIQFEAFSYDSNVEKDHVSNVTIPASVTYINGSAFKTLDEYMLILTDSDAYAKTYAINHQVPYRVMSYSNVSCRLLTKNYKAFESLRGDVTIIGRYPAGTISNNVYNSESYNDVSIISARVNTLDEHGMVLTYPDNRDSLRYGDTYVTITGKDIYNNDYSTNCLVNVSKAIPGNYQYKVPTGLVALIGQSLSEIELPRNDINPGLLPGRFEWMNCEELISESGEQIFKARFIPDDTDNYEIVENVDVIISVENESVGVLFNSNDGKNTLVRQNVDFGQSFTLEANTFTRHGYTFAGWNTKANGNGTSYEDEQEITLNSGIMLYAQWEPIVQTYRYRPNGGTGQMVVEQGTFGEYRTIYNPFTRTGYKFKGWSPIVNNNDSLTMENEIVYIISYDHIIDFYAYWEPIRYTIEYNENGGTGVVEQQEVSYGEEINLRENSFTKDHYVFAGWSTTPDGEVEYQPGETVSNLTTTDGDVITLYAVWHPWTYYIRYFANGGTGSMERQQLSYGVPTGLSNNGFTKTGYNFEGWSSDSNGMGVIHGENDQVNIPVSQNGLEIYMYAIWTPISYTIEYNANNGTGVVDPQDVIYDETFNIRNNNFIRDNYEFIGWNTETNGTGVSYTEGQEVSNLTTTDDDVITLYAQWEKISGTITFNANNGTDEVETQDVALNTNVTLDSNQFTKDGYIFTGWNTASDGSGTSYTDEQTVNLNDDLILYAQWSPMTYYIKYIANGGTGTMESQQVTTEDEVHLMANGFTAPTGYKFNGWSEISDGTGDKLDPNDAYNFTPSQDGEEKNIYAIWQPIEYTVEYNGNYGVGVVDPQNVSYDETFSIRTNSFTRGDYSFAGWNTDPLGNGTAYSEGQEVSNLATEDNSYITLYAQWVKSNGTITFAANNGTQDETTQNITLNTDTTLDANPFIYPGHIFIGWNIYQGGDGISYDDEQIVNLNDNLVLYAQWQAMSFTFNYNANGGTGTTNSQNYQYGDTVLLSNNGFTKEGYKFEGWSETSEGTGEIFGENDLFNYNPVSNNEEKTFYAIWQPIEYIVEYNGNYGVGVVDPQNVSYDETFSIRTNSFTRGDYSFAGWNTDPLGNGTAYSEEQEVSNLTTEDNSYVTLYAQWVKTNGTITYKANNGTQDETTQNITLNTDTTLDANPFTKSTHVFTGWNTASDGSGTSYTDEQTVNLSGDLTLYAQWRGYKMTFVYDANGGSGNVESQVYYYGEDTVLQENSFTAPTGYKFKGWSQVAEGTGDIFGENDSIAISTSEDDMDVTFYAIWEPITYHIAYLANGATGEMESQTVRYDEEVTIKENEFVRDGYKFIGWNTAPDGSGTDYIAGATMSNITTSDNAEERLYAQWEEINASIATFTTGIDFGSEEAGFQEKTQMDILVTNDGNISVTLDVINPTANGPFGCIWFDKEEVLNPGETRTITLTTAPSSPYASIPGDYEGTYQIVAYDAETKEEVESLSVHASIIINAVPITGGTITFYANNGTDQATIQNITFSIDVSLDSNEFEYPGFSFIEWNTSPDGSGDSYTDEQIVNFAEDKVLYAIWKDDFQYAIRTYDVDEVNSYIGNITPYTKVNDYTANFDLGYGFGLDVETKNVNGQEVLYTGGKTRITHGLETYKEYANAVTGEINSDGLINSADLLKIVKHLKGNPVLTDVYLKAADCNKDKTINSADLMKIVKFLKGTGTL